MKRLGIRVGILLFARFPFILIKICILSRHTPTRSLLQSHCYSIKRASVHSSVHYNVNITKLKKSSFY